MANLPLLSISGRIQQLPSGSVLEVQQAAGLDTDQAGSLLLGASTATSIDIGSVGVLTTIKGDLRIDGTETVVGNSTFESDAEFQGNIILGDAAADTLTINATTDYAAGNVTATGNPTWNFGSGQADFDGNLDANAGLDVTGATTLTGQVDQIGGAQVTLSGNLDADVGLDVTGATTMAGSVTQTGGSQVTLSGNLDADAGLDVSGGDLTLAGTGALSVSASGSHIISAGDLSVDVDTDFGGSAMTATGNPTWNFGSGQADFDGNLDANAGLDVTGATTMAGALTQTGGAQVTLSGNLDANDGIDITGGDLSFVATDGSVFAIAEADATISQTGSGQVTFSGNLDADGGLDVTGATTLTGQVDQIGGAQVTLSGNLDAQDGVDITGGDFLFTATDGSVFRITEADATMTQTGTAQVTLGGNLDADGGLDVSGADFTMTDATGGVFTIAQATGAITQSTAAQVTLAGNLDATNGLDVTGASTHQGGDYTFTDATGASIVFDNATGGITQSALGANTLAGDTTVTGDLTAAGNFYSSTYAQASGAGLYVDGGVLAAISSTSFLGYTFDVSGSNPSMTQSGSGVNYFSGQISAGLTVVRDGYSILMINSGGDIADFQHAGDALILNQQPDKAPQVTQTTNASIAAPTNGMIIYDTGTNQMLGYINGSWTDMGSAVESVSQVVAPGIDTSALSVGELGYYSANKTLTAADNSAAASSIFGGVCKTSDASGEAIVSGVAPMAFTAAPSAGDLVYMDGGANAGNATTTAPSAAGEYVAELGVCMTSAADGDGNYEVMLAVKATVEIS